MDAMEVEAVIARAVAAAIDETNAMLDPSRRIESSAQTKLAGALESLTLINLAVALEEQLEAATGASLSLADKLGAEAFQTVGSLTRWLADELALSTANA